MAPSDARFMDRADWEDLEACLATIIPTYERLNRAMSLGQVGRWRRQIQRHIRPDETVVELGSGPGQFAAGIPHARRILVDPLRAMQEAAGRLLDGNGLRYDRIVGAGEAVPLRDGLADHVVCAFSFRDFLDKEAGLREMRRLLRPGGRLWILDVRKPPGGVWGTAVGFHVRRVVPVLGRLLTPRDVRRGWKGDPYRAFAKTYGAFGTPDVYVAMAKRAGLEAVRARALSLGGAMLLTAMRPRS